MYNENMPVTISQFRKDLFKMADSALEGKTVEFTHKGVVFKVVPEEKLSRMEQLARLTPHPDAMTEEEFEKADAQLKTEIQASLLRTADFIERDRLS